MAVEAIVQVADEHGDLHGCWSYGDLPLDRSCRITVISPSLAMSIRVADALRAALQVQGGTEGGCGGNAGGRCITGCRAHSLSGVTQLVVVAVSGASSWSSALESSVQTFLAQADARALGLLPAAEAITVLPPSARPFQAVRFVADVGESVEDILAAAGADLEERKVFLSYSRADAAHALDLAEALADQRFSVYLDTRSNPAGSIWDDVLRDALVDAGIVVVLETANSYKSRWVKKELGLALARGAGVIAVQPTGGPYAFRAASARYVGPPKSAGPFIAEQHRLRLSAQREVRLQSVLAALRSQGVVTSVEGANIRANGYLIGIHERPVEVRQLRRTCETAKAMGLRVATYSPLPVLEIKRTDRNWIHTRASAAAYAEGTLVALARWVATP
ncbi:toll/interleukin-1 receptor domain-containing protein [Segeticoccus rhizosphaerae]|jgi:hypothetical protein|uniref:toll/interleukin-1 receptor domain-containing protein n=1 Tax=Segeticoccus rhizosphaerae TaxID=1104777 RepID=UPI001265A2B7|nr:toll/interleukin-1 receptor domain-containing protein [Segeticoccus rhizosphaerae]